jgi:hypothetical protein
VSEGGRRERAMERSLPRQACVRGGSNRFIEGSAPSSIANDASLFVGPAKGRPSAKVANAPGLTGFGRGRQWSG